MTEISVASEPSLLDSRCESLSHAVVEAVADAEGTDPLELEPLYETVDPDALDALFSGIDGEPIGEGEVSFTYHGYEVSVDSEGSVSLAESTDRFRIGSR